jgi:hypothetical protein
LLKCGRRQTLTRTSTFPQTEFGMARGCSRASLPNESQPRPARAQAVLARKIIGKLPKDTSSPSGFSHVAAETDVFVSYSHRDEQFVDNLIGLLATHGKTAWLDRKHICAECSLARGNSNWHCCCAHVPFCYQTRIDRFPNLPGRTRNSL